ncbi:phage tail tape measure protein [Comamonas terrae]|uniref:Phage tail tape measure protein n=1 Tax=Comamonas terrae TaxID=673548 RepID=A0ABW5UPY6_9BURK|nr:phage tail tape measure protein [Comamonas terrae]
MSDGQQRIGIYLDLFGAGKAQTDLKAVGSGLNALGPASQAGARAATQHLGSMQVSAAQTAAALRGVPAQFTDIVVSLQSGQQPLTVLLQQGGQLKDMFGGIVPAARALSGYVLGLINPLTLLAGSVVALGVAYYQGSQEQDNFNKAIVMSGNQAGVTAGKLAEMAKALAGQGYSQSSSADVLAKLVETGKVGEQQLEKFAAVAMDLEKRAGIPIAKTVENMAALGKDPVQASIRLNEQYGYLTAATLAQVKAADEEGRSAEAAARAQQAWADSMAGRTRDLTQNLGYIQRAWEGIKSAASSAWNAMLNVGRPETEDDVLARLRNQLAARKAQAPTVGNDAAWQAGNAKLEAQISNLEKALATKNGNATQAAANQAIQNAGIAALSAVQQVNDMGKTKAEQASDAIEKYRQNIDKLRASLAITTDPKERQALEKLLQPAAIKAGEAALRKKYEDKGAGAGAVQRADRRLDLSELQNAMRQEQAMVSQQQQQLELSRSAGLISLEDYYRQKRALIEKNASIDESGTRQQIDRLEEEKTKGADALNVQKQIVDLRGKLAVRQIQTQNELASVDQQAAQAARLHAESIRQLGTAYEAYVTQLQRRADLEVAAEGMGDRRRGYEQGLLSVRENYAAQMRQLDDQKGMAAVWTPENEQYYQAKMAYLRKQQEEEVRIYGDTYNRIGEAQANWINGAMRATENFLDSSRNVAAQTADAFTRAFSGMEDALVSFAMTGKADFKSLANSIIADIVRVQARAALSGVFGSLMGLFGKTNAGSAGVGGIANTGIGFGSMALNAKGGVYASQGLSQYRNQVIDQPTFFAFAKGGIPNLGVGGEAGPEAIMPLTRGPDGNLGVRATGGGTGGQVNVQFEVHNYAGAQIRQREEASTMPDGSVLKRFILEVVGESFTSGSGAAYQGAKQRFGWGG